ncbi:MAG: RdgB/HAM1 family non-canonical purine NTP pyrophosphatase [Coraliomargaritaceae bacterium]
MKQLILATGNDHKAEEFKTLLDGLEIEVLTASACGGMPNVVEDGDTFTDNAELKAKALRCMAPSDAWVLADDSGLEVSALRGAPGIYSARYAGPDSSDEKNLEKLLMEMEAIPEKNRMARFYCVLCLIDPDGHTTFYDGACLGRIACQATGADGFGYDPVFIPDGHDKSFAQLGDAIKNQISHRARAAEWLASVLSELKNETP